VTDIVIPNSSHPKTRYRDRPLHVVLWGTYDLGKPRTRILRDGLREIGVEVTEIHADIWRGHADKSQLGKAALFWAALRALVFYPLLVFRYLTAPRHDVVIVPYLGQLDVVILWPFARLRGRAVVLDMFLSLTDTVVHDRRLVAPGSFVARALWALEWLSCRAADRVLMDARAHGDYIAELFSLPSSRMAAVPVGAEPGTFTRLPPAQPHKGSARILFYGQLIPLHGVETILKAALSVRGRAHQWHLIGTGQMRSTLEAALGEGEASHITWEKWVPYTELTHAIAETDICLGIFGASRKAASVVPNKVYQALMAGRSVITRASPAMADTFVDNAGLVCVPHSDPEAILDAIDTLIAAGFPAMQSDALVLAQPAEIAAVLCKDVLIPLSLRRKSPC